MLRVDRPQPLAPSFRFPRPASSAAFVLLSLVATACGAGRIPAWKRPLALERLGDDRALVRAGEMAFADRENPKRLRAAIDAWEKATATNPLRVDTYVKLSRAYFLLADERLAPEVERDERRRYAMLEAYEKGITAAERGLLVQSPVLREKLVAGAKPESVVHLVPKAAVPLLYWYAVNLGKWARAQGMLTASYHRKCVHTAVQLVLKLDRAYWYAGADRYLGAYYAFLSGVMGGDAARAKEHFDAALRLSPQHLGTKVLLAEIYYGKRRRDRTGFEKTLREVLAADPGALPDIEPEQRAAQRRAQALLKKADEIFF